MFSKVFCLFAFMALLLVVSANPIENNAAEEFDADDLTTAQQFYGGYFRSYPNYHFHPNFYSARNTFFRGGDSSYSSESLESDEHHRFF